MMRLSNAIAFLVFASGTAAAQEEDGQLAFNNNCRTCHSTDEGDNRLGPNLNGIVGREAGTAEGYRYSDALARAGFTWDAETLDQWIENPDDVVSGHKMQPYSGIPEPEVREQIIAHLEGT